MSIFETQYYINGEQIRPVNADEIGFKMDWTGDPREAELSVDTIILANKAKKMCIEHLDTIGAFEGLPITIKAGDVILEYYIDFTESPILSGFGDSEIEVSIKRRKGATWFVEQARGLSFEVVNKTHKITTIDVPYLIVKDNQLEMLIMLAISTYSLTKALIEGIKSLAEAIADLTAASTPNTGVPPSIDTGDIIKAALKVLAQLAYVALLIVALIELTKQIIELIFPPIRYLKGSKVKELLNKGCNKLGFSFKSTLIDEYDKMTVLPVPMKRSQKSIFTNLFTLDNGSYTKGYPTARDTTPTLWSLIEAMQDLFNAKIRIVDNTVFLERRDYWQDNSGVQINRTLSLQDVRENRYRLNTGEAWKRYLLLFRTDPSDIHTMDNIDSTDCEYSTEPVTVINADLVSIKGLVNKNIPFAYGTRKDGLTVVEDACLPFAKLADDVTDFFGQSAGLEAAVKGRIGVTQISQQYYSASKLLYTVGGRQPSNFRSIIGANAMYQKFHYINQVKDNFKRIHSASIPFSKHNFEMLLDNNYVTDEQGNSLEILNFEWINENKTAEIEYTESSNEGNNTKTTLINA